MRATVFVVVHVCASTGEVTVYCSTQTNWLERWEGVTVKKFQNGNRGKFKQFSTTINGFMVYVLAICDCSEH